MNDLSLIEAENRNHFNQIIKDQEYNKLPILVDFWAPWCGPCQVMLPELEKVKKTYGKNLVLLKVNVDNFPDLANEYEIRSIPTLILFTEKNKPIAEAGRKSEDEIMNFLQKHCSDLSVSS